MLILGVNVNIIGGVRIGNDVIIGAGAVVTKDVESHCVIGGNPASILKMLYKFPIHSDLTEGSKLEKI
ncbi:acetyltransferase-like isoleucine patch superfamily enzyme [Pedobacter agri]|nr:acetyltransferase-like isoleucine patch superfamily enzyme [Pedobacter agri]